MNILLVSSYLPYPLTSGGHIRLFNLIKQLAKEHVITLVCEKRPFQTQDDIRALEKYCKEVYTVDRKKQWSLQTIARTGLSPYPFLLTGHRNNRMRRIIKELLNKERFDLIHIETFYVMQNLPETKIPTVLVEHNVEYLVYKRFAQFAKIFLQPVLYIDVFKLWYWERRYWEKATKLVAVSEEEKNMMKRSDVDIVPNGVDIQKFKMKKENGTGAYKILFIGDFKWIQNRDTTRFILEEIWPRIHNSKLMIHNSIKLWIVGKNIPEDIKKAHNGEDILIDENASKETEEIFQKASVLLSPIRVGGGTSYKILEAMASGVPVITTSLGREGIKAQEGEEILIADNAQEIATKLLAILSDERLYEHIAKNARRLVEENYDWEIITKKLVSVYNQVTKKEYD